MLVYHPAFDLYHCVFRLLQILENMKRKDVEVDRLRIWDFYLTFPNEARNISFPNELRELKRVFRSKDPNPYEDLVDAKRILYRMKSYQVAGLKCLASYDLIDTEELNRGIVKRTERTIPHEIKEKLGRLNTEQENILKLVQGFNELPLFGRSGLKDRTGLIDFKYDAR
jgi:hypothetical protein